MLTSSGTLQPKNRKAAIAKSLTVCVICLSTIQALCPIPKRKKNVLDITYRYFKTGANVLERIINYCRLQLGFSPSHMGKLFSCLKEIRKKSRTTQLTYPKLMETRVR